MNLEYCIQLNSSHNTPYSLLLCYQSHWLPQSNQMDGTAHNLQLWRTRDILQWIRNHRMIVKPTISRAGCRGEILPASSPRSIFINLPVRFSQINHLPSSLPLATYSPTNQAEVVTIIVSLPKLHADPIPLVMTNCFSVIRTDLWTPDVWQTVN